MADWDALEALLARTLYADCGWLAGEEGCLLTVEPVATPRRDRERWAQLAFEAFNVAGFFALDAPVAALYAVGRPSGTVIDVGHDKTDVAVVLDGGVVPGSVTRMASGGAAAEALLAARLAGRGVDVGGLDPVALRAAKQAVAAVRPSREAALADMAGGNEPAAAHTLPDGTPLPPSPRPTASRRGSAWPAPPTRPPSGTPWLARIAWPRLPWPPSPRRAGRPPPSPPPPPPPPWPPAGRRPRRSSWSGAGPACPAWAPA